MSQCLRYLLAKSGTISATRSTRISLSLSSWVDMELQGSYEQLGPSHTPLLNMQPAPSPHQALWDGPAVAPFLMNGFKPLGGTKQQGIRIFFFFSELLCRTDSDLTWTPLESLIILGDFMSCGTVRSSQSLGLVLTLRIAPTNPARYQTWEASRAVGSPKTCWCFVHLVTM